MTGSTDVTTDAVTAKPYVQPNSTVVAVLIPVALLVIVAGVAFNAAWNWPWDRKQVSATVTKVRRADSGDTSYEVDYDGIRADVSLHDVHEVGDLVEVLFDPANPDKLKSNSDVAKDFTIGFGCLAFGAGLVIILVADRRSSRRAVSATALTSGSR